jgi:hypothetical protein
MSRIDKWPSTPIKQVTSWAMTVILFLVCLAIIWINRTINWQVFTVLAGFVFGDNAIAAYQFHAKRKTAWPDVTTKSEATAPDKGGQPADTAPIVSAVRIGTSAHSPNGDADD